MPQKAPRKPRNPLTEAQRANIRAGALAAVSAGHWPAPGPLWTPAEDAQLGTMPDSAIARILGRTVGSVGARRHKLGIPAATGRGRQKGWRKHPTPAPKP